MWLVLFYSFLMVESSEEKKRKYETINFFHTIFLTFSSLFRFFCPEFLHLSL